MGAINSMCIGIKAPPNDSKIDYFCYKQKYNVNTQAAVGSNLMFLKLAIGYSRSVHNSRVLQNSTTFQMRKNGDVLLYVPWMMGAP